MKIKKEFIILIIIIIVLSGYLYFKRTDRIHYTLPDLTALETEKITGMEIVSADGSIVLKKKDDTWYISEKEYPADAKKTQTMLDVLKDLAITDLISQSGNFILYDLQDGKKITVRAYAGTDLVRDFDIGKKAPTYKHTFIRLRDDDRVYQANGDFRKDFETTVADLRDKRVLTFDTGDITSVTVSGAQGELALTKEETTSGATGDQAGKEQKTFQWKDGSGNTVEGAVVDKLLGTLSTLQCQEYLEDKAKTDLKSPETTITLKGKDEYSLRLFIGEGEDCPALSSDNAYAFVLPQYRIDSIKKSIAELTGTPPAP